MRFSSAKKICFGISSLAGGGAEKSVLRLCQIMAERGHIVHLILIDDKTDYDIPEYVDKCHILSDKFKKSNIRFIDNIKKIFTLKKIIKEEEKDRPYDLIVSNLSDADKVFRYIGHNNLHFCIRNNESAKSGNSIFRKIKFILRYRNKNIISISKGLRKDLIDNFHIKPSNITTIYNGYDFDNIRNLSNEYSPKYQHYILHIGRFTKQKRHDILFESFKLSEVSHQLILVGPFSKDDKNKLTTLIEEYELQDKVIIHGFEKNPYPLIKKADLLILSSDYEGLSNVIIESLALNTPVASTNCPYGPSEILTDELKQLLSPTGDPAQLAKNITLALNLENIEFEKYINGFSIESTYNRYMSLINQKGSPQTIK